MGRGEEGNVGGIGTALPPLIAARLEHFSRLLGAAQTRRVSLSPLVLRRPVEELLARRKSLFSEWRAAEQPFGYTIGFARGLRPTPHTPQGRKVAGEFDIIQVNGRICLLVSSAPMETEVHGPRHLARRAYPLATRPLLGSEDLVRIVSRLATQRGWAPLCADAIGYDRHTGEFRRDMKHQPVADAFREMAEQGRQMHQMRVLFQDEATRQALLAVVNRYGRATVYRGDVTLAASHLVLAVATEASDRWRRLSVNRARDPGQQTVVQLGFPADTFATSQDTMALCSAVRRGVGLNVTTVHLNPYLNAQVLDYLTGQSVELVVLDDRTVSLIPRCAESSDAMQRVVALIFRFFGEGEVRVAPVLHTS